MKHKYDVRYTKRFEKEVEKLSSQDRRLVFETVRIIESNPYYQSLRTKKIEGQKKNSKDLFESRVNRDIRLFWCFDDEKLIFMLRVGHHNILNDY
jgi:mRNA-degrading endonuclease RelE of RelBE toxin-antitoxin system